MTDRAEGLSMKLTSIPGGLVVAVLSALSFGTSGALVKPLLEAGWSPAAAVTVRAFTAGLVLLPLALVALRGRWRVLWIGRWRVLGMGVVGVAFTQLAYFAAISTIPVSTALLIEFLAPLILVGVAWAVSKRMPRPAVFLGSALAVGGLVLVIGPGAIQAVDPLGLLFAFLAAIGCAAYFFIAARPDQGLPPIALAAFGLLVGGLILGLLGLTGVLALTATFEDLPLFGSPAPWWVPLVLLVVVSTAVAYGTGITATGVLGSRLASFVGLLEVVFASLFAWLLLGEQLTPLQLLGGLLILGGIAAVRSDRGELVLPSPFPADASAPVGHAAPGGAASANASSLATAASGAETSTAPEPAPALDGTTP
ncbi:DMT family transporter [Cryobacterium sp. CG_9.6]|uniref:EamA family transporter n=1 Tax=Cryobacterium sp. CG_9.6 TaxID=2760710 RepID=UPI002475DDD4|nr:DMT family transporter [Cryobacterium sp. CG_9.6]MDH6235278.1 drug/metabolite transporter (DMT)-like permease [Cryobacterium sp. CG_9.6]